MSRASRQRRTFSVVNGAESKLSEEEKYAPPRNSASWRSLPATDRQWAVLRRIGRSTGDRFDVDISRGEASDVIGERFGADPAAARVARRAARARAHRSGKVGPC